jgi:hypothetical protein
LDTGNLVVKDGNVDYPEKFMWQSYDYPCDTLLPEMKLGCSGGATAVFGGAVAPPKIFSKNFFYTQKKKKKKKKNHFTYPFHGTPNISSTTITSQESFYLAVFNKVVKKSGLRIFCPISCLDATIIITKQSNSPFIFSTLGRFCARFLF